MLALLGMVSLAVDVGYWRYQQRLEQSASDSAAVAGAIALNYPNAASTGTPTTVAQAVAASTPYGYQDDGGVGNLVVSVSTTPAPPPRPGATAYPANTAVEVTIKKKQPSFFSGIFGNPSPFVSARAVAVVAVDLSSCLYQLQTGPNSGFLTFSGNKPIDLKKCGLLANGPIDDGGGFGSTTTTVGHLDTLKYAPTPPTTSYVLPRAVTDPCFKIATCAYLATQYLPPSPVNPIDAKTTAITNPNPSGSPYASPVYVTNCCGSATTFPPGMYYVYQGSASQMGPIYGVGVTIVNVDGNFNEGGLGAGAGAATTISAPTSGPTAGIAYYHPATSSNQGCTLNGGGNNTTVFNGLFYAPATQCTYNGGSLTFSYLVIGSIRDNGGGNGNGIVVDPSLSVIAPGNPGLPTHVVIDQ